jgi:hypothetical protein
LWNLIHGSAFKERHRRRILENSVNHDHNLVNLDVERGEQSIRVKFSSAHLFDDLLGLHKERDVIRCELVVEKVSVDSDLQIVLSVLLDAVPDAD